MADKLILPYIFSDHMVLQRGKSIPVWGESDTEVTVVFQGKTYRGVPTDGKFRVDMDASEAATGLTLLVKNAATEITFQDVAVGEVWIAGGQSNMSMRLLETTNGMLDAQFQDFGDNLRYFSAPQKSGDKLVIKNNRLNWVKVAEDDGSMTAVGYYFAQRLYQMLQVPVGVIDCNCGATSILHWVKKEAALQNPVTAPYVYAHDCGLAGEYPEEYRDKLLGASNGDPYGFYYENQLKDICPYAVAGVIWYQGEADGAGEKSAEIYKTAFRMFLSEWRSYFENPTLPVAMVMLANYGGDWIGYSGGEAWAYMREAQMSLAETEENVYYVSALDRGHEDNIHPVEKKFVGERLAACVLAQVYGKDIRWKCPTVDRIEIADGKLKIFCKNTYGRLYADCGTAQSFALKTYWRYWLHFDAEVVEDHLEINVGDFKPVEIRHCFENNPKVRIYNHCGLPLVPFRRKL